MASLLYKLFVNLLMDFRNEKKNIKAQNINKNQEFSSKNVF